MALVVKNRVTVSIWYILVVTIRKIFNPFSQNEISWAHKETP